jgi:hypothetical protein
MLNFDNSGKRFATLGKNNSLIQFLSLCNFSNIANRDFEN